MKTIIRSSLILLSVLLVITLAPAARAASATIEGIVTDVNGRPIPRAEVRIQGREGSGLNATIKTDRRGHYSYGGLSDGTFKVTLSVNGTVKASIANVTLQLGQNEQLNFALTKIAAARPSAVGKHYIWVPASTGSQVSGSWVEVNADPSKMPVGMRERVNWSANAAVRHIQANAGQARQGL
jgi:hypothetical protein